METELDTGRHDFAAKWYLNGFPKSGLHLATLMMRPVAKPLADEGLFNRPWAGTFQDNSWTARWVPPEKVLYKISRLTDGHFLKGHCAYVPAVERFLWYAGISHVFIYRDLRDVAVSQSYHVISEEDDRMSHPDKALYRAMDSHEDVLKAVVGGYRQYPGVLDRWATYVEWMNVGWTLRVRFEDLRERPYEAAARILRYGLGRVAPIFECQLKVVQEVFDLCVEAMVQAGADTAKSPTFRKGTVGQWREEFTPEIKALFKDCDRENWLVKLGYERDSDW